MKLLKQLGAVVLSCALASQALAWGAEGHRIVGLIAHVYLDQGARAAVEDLLDGESLADVSTWADEIRGNHAYDWARPLHYIDVPRDATEVDLPRDCVDGRCVVQAIHDYAAILGDATKPRDQRVEALKFLVHFVGDVHQPLHVSYADDKGGNDVHVTFFGAGCSLHQLWDEKLIARRATFGWEVLGAELVHAIDAQQAGDWARSLDPIEWANESLTITRTLYPIDGDLGQAYYDDHIGTVEERLEVAGVRLAALLNDILAGQAVPIDPADVAAPVPVAQDDEPRDSVHQDDRERQCALKYRVAWAEPVRAGQ
jgi:nuclease S1